MEGVVRTVVGYSGGKERDPTYRNIKDSTECILIEYDPSLVTFRDLLVEWANMHNPRSKRKTQYRSAIFYADDGQKRAALEAVKGLGRSVCTAVEPVGPFYRAEEYHQNFLARRGAGGAAY
uniref:peptide-methionine (S)-S-oxide reductase n=1 Tax=Trieres chinensis TaxID=1514140 RepID=A0A7S2EM11_TRICV|mmetsp:Transcript_30086/g.61385  ORF Transcript_30086/g.61385 Transcript_30086/m.61385 type:complete len:121 (+) Transcript_30086:228-590(+)